MDGEEPGIPSDGLEAHLDMCLRCRKLLADADELNRLFSVNHSRAPDLTEAILSAVGADVRRRPGR